MSSYKIRTLSPLSLLCAAVTAFADPTPATAPAPQASGELVTIIGKIDPKFSFPTSEADMQRIAHELRGLKDLPPITININDLFAPGDEKAIQDAANNIATKFVAASQILIDLRAMVYRAEALKQLVGNSDDKKAMQAAFQQRFLNQYTTLLATFAQVDPVMAQALYSCRSEMCVNSISVAQREMVSFARALTKRTDFKPQKGTILVAAIENTYKQAYAQAESQGGTYPQLVKSALGGWVSNARDQASVRQVLDTALGSEKSLKKLKYKAPSLPSKLFSTELAWWNDLVSKKLQQLILNPAAETLAVPVKTGHARTHVLTCDYTIFGPSGHGYGGRGEWHAVVYGQTKDLSCKNVRDGLPYRIDTRTFGPGALGLGIGGLVFVITSPVNIDASGTWVGLNVGFGAVILGGEIGLLMGKSASHMTALMGGTMSLGARVGVKAVTITPITPESSSYPTRPAEAPKAN